MDIDVAPGKYTLYKFYSRSGRIALYKGDDAN